MSDWLMGCQWLLGSLFHTLDLLCGCPHRPVPEAASLENGWHSWFGCAWDTDNHQRVNIGWIWIDGRRVERIGERDRYISIILSRRTVHVTTWSCVHGIGARSPFGGGCMSLKGLLSLCQDQPSRWASRCLRLEEDSVAMHRKLNFIIALPYLMSVSQAAGDVLMKLELYSL